MPLKLQSRKFWLALIAQLTGLAVLIFPEHDDAIAGAAQHVAALMLMALTSMGYIKGEAQIDAANVAKGQGPRATGQGD